MHFNKSYILVLFKCFFKVDWNFNLSLNKKEKLQICQTLNFYTLCWIMQWSVNYSSPSAWDSCALKSMQKWGYRMWCCVNTFHSGLLTRQIFVSTLILVFLMFASNKVPVTNQFQFACFSFWFRMIHCQNDITAFFHRFLYSDEK